MRGLRGGRTVIDAVNNLLDGRIHTFGGPFIFDRLRNEGGQDLFDAE